MVHEKFIRHGEKVHGPYYYKSYRDSNGNIKKVYLGKENPNNIITPQEFKKLTKSTIIFIILIFTLISFLFIIDNPPITGKAVDDVVSFGILEPTVEETVIEENKTEEIVEEEIIGVKPVEEMPLEEIKDNNTLFENSEIQFKAQAPQVITECRTMDTLGDSFILSADVQSNDSSCFNITASNVVLDCDGHMINYSTDGLMYYAVNVTSADNVIIKNCNIIDGNSTTDAVGPYSISLDSSNNVTIYNNSITTGSNSSTAIYLLYSNNTNVTQNNITVGGSCFEAGMSFGALLSDYLELNENNITLTGFADSGECYPYNVLLFWSNESTITNNELFYSADAVFGYNIYLFESNISNISGNLINLSGLGGSYGINLINSSEITIENNTVLGDNQFSLLTMFNTNSSNIRSNVFQGANISGVLLGGFFNNFEENVIDTTLIYSLFIGFEDNLFGIAGSNTFLNNNLSAVDSFWDNIADGSLLAGMDPNYLIYNNQYGQINWSGTNLSTNITLNISVDSIIIENNNIGLIDDPESYEINQSENLTAAIEFYGLNHTSTPYLYKNGNRCDNDDTLCNITYDIGSGILYANVSSFSNYTTDLEPVATISFSSNPVILSNFVTVTCSAIDSGGNLANISLSGDEKYCNGIDSCSITYSPTLVGQICFTCTAIDAHNYLDIENSCFTVNVADIGGSGGTGGATGGETVETPQQEIPVTQEQQRIEQQVEAEQQVQQELKNTEEQQITVSVNDISQVFLQSVDVVVNEDKSQVTANLDSIGELSLSVFSEENIIKPQLNIKFKMDKQIQNMPHTINIQSIPITINFGFFNIVFFI